MVGTNQKLIKKNSYPPPFVFGLPEKFQTWRPDQESALDHFQQSQKRIVVQVQPTGAGKSLCYMANAILSGGRTLILTGTKALQDQLQRDFGQVEGVAIVKGRSAYTCVKIRKTENREINCDQAPCLFGQPCDQKSDCKYLNAVKQAARAQIVITNYSFWFANSTKIQLEGEEGEEGEERGEEEEEGDTEKEEKKSNRIGLFDVLICDEAHSIGERICDALCASVLFKDCNRISNAGPECEAGIWSWVHTYSNCLKQELKDFVARYGIRVAFKDEQFKAKHKICTELWKLEGVEPKNCVVELLAEGFTIDPLWPGDFIHSHLIREIKKVLFTSATLTKAAIDLLGINATDMDFIEFPSHFPVLNRAVILIPTCRVDFRTKPAEERLWLGRIDQIIRGRLDRKGIIHTVSYSRARQVLIGSEYNYLMRTHDKFSAQETIEEFKRCPDPCILVSPSVVTGYDFPYSECEYQIIAKVPFPDMRRKVDKKRKELDNEYGMILAMQAIVQAAGRGVRAIDDHCETFIIDDHFGWFFRKNKHLAPKSFLEAVGKRTTIPGAPCALSGHAGNKIPF